MDMTIADVTQSISRIYIFQVISNNNNNLYNFVIQEESTTLYFILCRISQYFFKARVKMKYMQPLTNPRRKSHFSTQRHVTCTWAKGTSFYSMVQDQPRGPYDLKRTRPGTLPT